MILPVRRRSIAMGACLLAGSCVTVYEDAPLIQDELATPEFAIAQTIPLGKPLVSERDQQLAQLYSGVLTRMQEAVDDRDLPVLFGLLDAYQKPGLPDMLADRLAGYRALAHGLVFLEHAVARASLELVAAAPSVEPANLAAAPAAPAIPVTPTIGQPLPIEFRLPASTVSVRLGGRRDHDPIGFVIAIVIEDIFVDGGTREQKNQHIEWLPEAVDLVGDAVLRLPLQLEVFAGKAVRRTVHLRVDLLGGYVKTGEFRAPVPRRTLAAMTLTQWPAGHEPIVARPLATLREALRLGDEAHYAHVFLGAVFTSGLERQQALELLVDQVRFAPQPLAVVAMATLRELTGAEATIGDREEWLAWWNTRR